MLFSKITWLPQIMGACKKKQLEDLKKEIRRKLTKAAGNNTIVKKKEKYSEEFETLFL